MHADVREPVAGARRTYEPVDLWAGRQEAVDHALARPGARKVLCRACDDLGRVLAGLGTLYAPDQIVVHSALFASHAGLWALVRERVRACPPEGERIAAILRQSSMPQTAAAEGAALHALATFAGS